MMFPNELGKRCWGRVLGVKGFWVKGERVMLNWFQHLIFWLWGWTLN